VVALVLPKGLSRAGGFSPALRGAQFEALAEIPPPVPPHFFCLERAFVGLLLGEQCGPGWRYAGTIPGKFVIAARLKRNSRPSKAARVIKELVFIDPHG
jgi:hypothetical protein